MCAISKRKKSEESAFTFIEIIIVIAIIASGYAILLPNFSQQSSTQVIDKLNRIGSDIRSAFDLAILNNKAYRLVFHLNSGRYWLEETNASTFYLGSGDKEGDVSEKREKELQEEFNSQFEKYTSLAGEVFKDEKGDQEIPPMSPVLRAKANLQRPTWSKVSSIEWSDRSIAPQLIIKDMRAEHHEQPVTLDSRSSEENFAHIYFLPKGYVERAYIHFYYLKGESIDESQPPWTYVTHPYRGEASLISGLEQIDLATPTTEE
jgi:type II secretory pathway pseudopilin PulG